MVYDVTGVNNMLINQASKTTGLTKKAVEYYAQQGLVVPSVLENGYRDYSEEDIKQLHKICVLRKLGISTHEIKSILSDNANGALQAVSVRQELDAQTNAMKQAILEKLSSGMPYSEIGKELQAVENRKTVTGKLLDLFPGYYGRFICLHFARFLDEPIQTAVQQTAFDAVVSFLDNVPPFHLPQDLEEYLIEGTRHIGTKQITELIADVKKSIENPDEFLSDNKEMLEQYLAYKKSDEYKNSPAYRVMELMKEFYKTSGYYDVFIPAVKELSSSYADYFRQLECANEKLLAQYPEIKKMSSTGD